MFASYVPQPGFPPPTMERVVRALVAGLHGAPFSDGAKLTVSTVLTEDQAPVDLLPVLCLRLFAFTRKEWQVRSNHVALSVTGVLKVAATASDRLFVGHRIVDELLTAVDLIQGLPVDRDGKVVRWTPEYPYLFRDGKVAELADRGGPYVRVGRSRILDGSPFVLVDVTLEMAFLQSHDTEIPRRAQSVAVHGLRVKDPQGNATLINFDVTSPLSPDEIDAVGQFDDDPPPGAQNVGKVLGADPAKVLRALTVTPQVQALGIAGTAQMVLAATYRDERTWGMAASAASWATTNPAVATVSSGGLVTGVGAGTAGITATMNGITSNAATITVA